MTDIEQRKAAAFEWIENLGILIPYDIGLTLLQVLKPFPQAPDSEVDEAIKYMQDLVDCIDEEGLDRENNQRHYRALIKAVQQPRQEWIPIVRAKNLIWEEKIPDLAVAEYIAYIDGLPHSVGNYKANYTVRKDRFDKQWSCTFWVGNRGHALIGSGSYNFKTAEEAQESCQKDFYYRIDKMLDRNAVVPPKDKSK